MLERKIDKQLKEWKESKHKKALLIDGPRQIGKTTSIRSFGEKNYKEVIEINFKLTPSMKEVFQNDLTIDNLIFHLKLRYPQYKLNQGETLIFLDEIQLCDEALSSLKFWTLDGRYDVIAASSFLKITNIGPSSFPVGSIDRLSMYSLDFEEFLWAKGFSPSLINELYTFFVNRTLVPEAINNEMMKTFRQFIAVGGMPDAVVTYLENQNDYKNVDIKQRELLEDYYNDIALYTAPYDKIKTQQCYMSLSKQLLDKENHKFQYCRVEKNGKGRKFYSSIQWLLDADLLKLCFNVRNIEYDLSDYKDPSNFRAYTNDLSLLIPTKDFYLKQKIIENSITTLTQKGIYECAIADILLKKNIPLYFYKNENTKKEIDFLIQREGNIVPIEVKSSNKRATSLNWLMEKKTNIPLSYKLVDGNIGVGENNIITIPLYMAMFL